ncbi:MAG TPA: extracellular solute-binding protein [Candidatus Limivivens merdigallinarum]|uniref:Extracellular solute-binding protein n=1 Tax=Candidatus Limivivens merdigallinarum TaxID=2840859 RepID=A0A9D0ZXR6_9FIRM|nr:extracellular solute-binding protein [Candidatus Limivivens merdigallinarum]
MKKKLISLLMTAAMVGSMMSGIVASASEETEAATEAASEAAGESTGGGTSDSLEDVSEPVTLSLMVTTRPSTDAKDFYLDLLPELVHERFPNITIEVEQLPTDQYKQTVRLRFASGEGPDLFTWWAQKQAEDLVMAEYVRDLSDFSLLDKFDSTITEAYTFDGKVYGLPLGTSFLTTWYNKDMFAEVGYDTYPTNWDEFIDVCQKLKDAGYTPITCGDNSSFVIQFAMYQIGASEIYAENPDFDDQLYTGETSFTDQCWVDTVTKLQYLYDNGYVVEDSLGLSQDQSRQLFIDGEAAMIFDGSFGYTQLMNQGAADFERGMFCVPSNAEGEDFVWNWTSANALFTSNLSDDLHQQACDLVMQYWFDEASPLFEAWVENTTDIIAFEGVSDSRDMINEYLERYQDYQSVENLNNAWPEGVSDEMCSRFQEVITGDATPEDVCQAMQDKFEELAG